jgi:hypothetical protein
MSIARSAESGMISWVSLRHHCQRARGHLMMLAAESLCLRKSGKFMENDESVFGGIRWLVTLT